MDYVITYVKKNSLIRNIFGYLLIIPGTVGIFFRPVLGAVNIAIGIGLLSTEGIQINLQKKEYRIIQSFFGLYIGKWIPSPAFEYVSVFKTKESQRVNYVTATTEFTYDIIAVNLFYNGNRHITFYKTADKAKAFKIAEHFRMVYNIDILDATGPDKHWLYND